MKFYVLPYDMRSISARLLARQLNALRIFPQGRNLHLHPQRTTVINWGCSAQRRDVYHPINSYEAVRHAANKLTAYNIFHEYGIPTVDYTKNQEQAQLWLNEGSLLYCRQYTNSHGGRGTTVIDPSKNESLIPAVFYTKYFPTKREFRVHVVEGKAILVQEKKKRSGIENINKLIRNHSNNWVFCVNDLKPYPENLLSISKSVVNNLGLQFGALDIALDKDDNVCVFRTTRGLAA